MHITLRTCLHTYMYNVHVYAAKYYVTEGKHLRGLKCLGRI